MDGPGGAAAAEAHHRWTLKPIGCVLPAPAVQRRCGFADGDLLEGQPIHLQKQWYRIVDAKTGLIEAGYVTVDDMLNRQPWPEPGDEFPVHVTARGLGRVAQ